MLRIGREIYAALRVEAPTADRVILGGVSMKTPSSAGDLEVVLRSGYGDPYVWVELRTTAGVYRLRAKLEGTWM